MLLSTLSPYYLENPSIILVLQARITDILQILDDLPQRTTKHTWIMMMEIMLGACEQRRGAKDGTVPTIVSRRREHPNILCSTQDTNY